MEKSGLSTIMGFGIATAMIESYLRAVQNGEDTAKVGQIWRNYLLATNAELQSNPALFPFASLRFEMMKGKFNGKGGDNIQRAIYQQAVHAYYTATSHVYIDFDECATYDMRKGRIPDPVK